MFFFIFFENIEEKIENNYIFRSLFLTHISHVKTNLCLFENLIKSTICLKNIIFLNNHLIFNDIYQKFLIINVT